VIERVAKLGTAQSCTTSQCNGGASPDRSRNHPTCVCRPAVVDITTDVEKIPNKNWDQECITEPNDGVGDFITQSSVCRCWNALRRLLPLQQPICA
jgi:hypothetical protein